MRNRASQLLHQTELGNEMTHCFRAFWPKITQKVVIDVTRVTGGLTLTGQLKFKQTLTYTLHTHYIIIIISGSGEALLFSPCCQNQNS